MSNVQMARNESPWHFGLPDRLAKALTVSGISHAQMASVLGVSTNTIGNYTSGRTAPRPPIIQVWAQETGAPLEWLLTGSEPPKTPARAGGGGLRRTLYLVDGVGPAGIEPTTSTVEAPQFASSHLAPVASLAEHRATKTSVTGQAAS